MKERNSRFYSDFSIVPILLIIVSPMTILGLITTNQLITVNHTNGSSCKFVLNCVSNCLYDVNQYGYSVMNFTNGLRPSSSWVNVTGIVTGDHNFTGINIFSRSRRTVLHISIGGHNQTVVLNYKYDNGSFEKYSQRIPNRWFKTGELFNLNVIPSLVDEKDQTKIKFLVNYVLPNGTLDQVGQSTIQLSPNDSIDGSAAIQSYGEIFTTSYCYGTCNSVKALCM